MIDGWNEKEGCEFWEDRDSWLLLQRVEWMRTWLILHFVSSTYLVESIGICYSNYLTEDFEESSREQGTEYKRSLQSLKTAYESGIKILRI